MIDLTRLNGHRLILNCDLIRFAEPAPDTTITLVTGEKLIVRESCDELIARTLAWRGTILRTAWPDAPSAMVAGSNDPALRHARPHTEADQDC